ncbi:phage tail protein [Sphingomonas hylomeconis]|uniref:Phage tail protein n=1 Tax=Sphingomonas hylomeconis TaxID=1395958 RepID=A0ABV7SXM6_9SPHN|nr:tail fiber protein [Sphingomonas hylomeconis]
MSTPIIAEIRMFAGNFPPVGWAFCDGQTLSIAGNDALFALIGTTYGGDGQTTFNLPDLRGRIPMGFGRGPGLSLRLQSETGGTEQVALSQANLPAHNHTMSVSRNPGSLPAPTNSALPASPQSLPGVTAGLYVAPFAGSTATINPVAMAPATVGARGGGTAHENRMPSLAVNFIIALQGIFPSRN